MSQVSSARAFTLVEVTLALGIAVFCLVVVFGLMNVGINTSSASVEQTNATNLLALTAADLRAAPTPMLKADGSVAAGAPSAIYSIALPVNGAAGTNRVIYLDASGQQVNANTPTARYQLNVWPTAGAAGSRDPTLVRLMVSWPPTTSAVKAGSVEASVALDRN